MRDSVGTLIVGKVIRLTDKDLITAFSLKFRHAHIFTDVKLFTAVDCLRWCVMAAALKL